MYINFLHILNTHTYTFERHLHKSGLTLNSNSLHLFCFHLKLEGVTPEPDSNEDSSDFMYEGIKISKLFASKYLIFIPSLGSKFS